MNIRYPLYEGVYRILTPQLGRQPCAPDRFLQYPHQFFEEKERFGWECKDENVSLS